MKNKLLIACLFSFLASQIFAKDTRPPLEDFRQVVFRAVCVYFGFVFVTDGIHWLFTKVNSEEANDINTDFPRDDHRAGMFTRSDGYYCSSTTADLCFY